MIAPCKTPACEPASEGQRSCGHMHSEIHFSEQSICGLPALIKESGVNKVFQGSLGKILGSVIVDLVLAQIIFILHFILPCI